MRVGAFSLFRKIGHVLASTHLSEMPGSRRLYTFIDRIISPKGMILITFQGNKMYVKGTDIGFSQYLLINKIYERYATELLKKLLRANMRVVDIGANMGYYTLIAAKLVGNGGRVYAFEPEPNNYDILVKNIEMNGYNNISVIQKAISDKQGKTKLFVNKNRPAVNSFSEENVQETADFVDGFFEVETTTLDDFFENIVNDTEVDFIKMDAVGAEGLIIEGARKILSNNNLKIIMSFWPYGLKNLGTDPLKLLHELHSYDFIIKRIGKKMQSLTNTDLMKLIEINVINPKFYVNLYLTREKPLRL